MTPRIHSLLPSGMVAAGLLFAFTGERLLGSNPTARIVFALLAAAAVLGALALRLIESGKAPEAQRAVKRMLVLTTAGVAVGLLLYGALAMSGDGSPKLKAILTGLWPIVLAASAGPLLAIELAVLPVAYIDRYELRRVRRAFERGLSMAVLVAILVLVNFLAKRHEVKTDLSLGKRTQASEGTRRIVRDLTKPVRVVLFFPKANEVAEALDPYFESLAALSKNLEVKMADQALATQLATETGITENGYVAVTFEKTHEKIRVGTNLRSARSALRSFDTDFAKAMVKISREKSVAYFTVGHGERSTEPPSEDKRPALTLLKSDLKANQYEVKPLGIAEGLGGGEIPKDASVVFVMGPEKPFLPEEMATLRAAVQKGVRLLIAVEPERAEKGILDPLLQDLGLKVDPTLLVNDQSYVRVSYTDADKAFIYSNRYSSHGSVTTMTRYSTKLATLFARAGSIDKIDPSPANTKVDIVVRALDGTFADKNDNLEFDQGAEERKSYGLAAAATRTATSGKDETRVFVTTDVDAFSDTYVRFQGNPYFWTDVLSWLRDVKDPVLPTVTEEDVRIVHKREEDALWFYSTTLGAPALVALIGVFGVRRRRRGS